MAARNFSKTWQEKLQVIHLRSELVSLLPLFCVFKISIQGQVTLFSCSCNVATKIFKNIFFCKFANFRFSWFWSKWNKFDWVAKIMTLENFFEMREKRRKRECDWEQIIVQEWASERGEKVWVRDRYYQSEVYKRESVWERDSERGIIIVKCVQEGECISERDRVREIIKVKCASRREVRVRETERELL